MNIAPLFALFPLAAATHASATQHVLRAVTWLPPTEWEQEVNAGRVHNRDWYVANKLYADRKVYWNDDDVGQLLARFNDAHASAVGRRAVVDVFGDRQAHVAHDEIPAMAQPKAALLLAVNALKPGRYVVRVTLEGEPAASIETTFTRVDAANPRVPIPRDGIVVELDPQDAVADGAWPVTAGVPFPPGAIRDLSTLELVEDGKPVPSQLEKVATWSPEADGVTSSVSWARLSFVSHYVHGKPASYRLRLREPVTRAREASRAAIEVSDDDDAIRVNTGAVRFVVHKHAFRGAELVDDQKNGASPESSLGSSLASSAGAYVVDERGVVYEAAADTSPSISIEEAGPVRVVIAAEGWYARADHPDQKLCRFITRIIAYAGVPQIKIEQGTVLTYDTNAKQLADVGVRVPFAGAGSFALGYDGASSTGELPADGSIFLHQLRADALRVVDTNDKAALADPNAGAHGRRSDGWFTLEGKGPRAVSVFVRDIWQKFPKEVELARDGFTLHFWPKHGVDAFPRAEILDEKNIYKLRWAEQGKLLDLAFPDDVYRALKTLDASTHWDVEHTADHARSGNAQGVVIGDSYTIRVHSVDEDERAQALLTERDPHARANGKWSAATGVEGEIARYDPTRFPQIEADVDTFFPDYSRAVVDAGDEYGMWSYADVHDNWDAAEHRADLHRVSSASHYRNVSTPWLLYFRGDSPENLIFAAANTDHFMNIDTVNWTELVDDPTRPGRQRLAFAWHSLGAMYHVKGFVPWGGTAWGEPVDDDHSGLLGHFTNPDAYRFRFLLEGNHRAAQLYRTWGEALKKMGIAPGTTRNNINDFGEMLAYYRATWDPDFIAFIDDEEEAMMSTTLAKMPNAYDHPGWHRAWHSRAFDLLRDPRIVTAVHDYCRSFGRTKPAMLAWAYERTHDRSLLDADVVDVDDASHVVYRNPSDPLNGTRTRFSADAMSFYQEMPYYLRALADAGVSTLARRDALSSYPSHTTHWDFTSEPSPSLQVLWLQPPDHDTHLRFDSVPGFDTFRPAWRVRGPDGAVVVEDAHPLPGSGRYSGPDAITASIPRSAKAGLYRLDLRSPDGTKLAAPVTDALVEAALLDRRENYQVAGRADVYLLPVGPHASATLTWTDRHSTPGRTFLSYVRLEDASGKVIFETTLLAGSARESASFTVDTTTMSAPYHLYQIGGYGPAWDGSAAELLAARRPDQAQAIARALEHAHN
jgi:hypothetical protein